MLAQVPLPQVPLRSHPHWLHKFPLIDTTNAGEFGAMLMSRFGALAFEPTAPTGPFEAQRSYFRFNNADILFGACSQAYKVRFPGRPMAKQQFALLGAGRTTFLGREYDITSRAAHVIPTGVEMTHEYQAGFQSFLFRADSAALQAKLSAAIGRAVTRPIEFDLRPSSGGNPAIERLRRTIAFTVGELDCDEDAVPAAALVEFEQMLLIAFLTANPHNYSHLLEREPPGPAPWQVRRVEEYISANWNHPITVEALAAAAGASARSIFKAFKDARNCSPMAFVKSIRLQHARELLQHPQSTTTVVSTAFACGFPNPGHFSRDYRLAFGELPSATLNACRHAGPKAPVNAPADRAASES